MEVVPLIFYFMFVDGTWIDYSRQSADNEAAQYKLINGDNSLPYGTNQQQQIDGAISGLNTEFGSVRNSEGRKSSKRDLNLAAQKEVE